eukprot:Skav224562  [mRNA]  locus=scaffold3952:3058:3318:+ [translate_table: standard]
MDWAKSLALRIPNVKPILASNQMQMLYIAIHRKNEGRNIHQLPREEEREQLAHPPLLLKLMAFKQLLRIVHTEFTSKLLMSSGLWI